MTDYLTYNCVVNTAGEAAQTNVQFECAICCQTEHASHIDRVIHHSKCLALKEEAEKDSSEASIERKVDPNAVEHNCKDCNRTLFLTPTEILRHKKSHL